MTPQARTLPLSPSRIARVFWVLAVTSLVIWALVPGYVVGWDLNVYRHALASLYAGHDPYLDGMAVQHIFHAHLAEHPNDPPPYTYVYSPITLPFLRAAGHVPVVVGAVLYWGAYILGCLAVLWVGYRLTEQPERALFGMVVPAAIFFPGLLQYDVAFAGNVATILYGAAFAAAYWGWRRERWWPFYGIVLLASCVKAPLLSLLALPALSSRRQWLPALALAAVGVGLFAMQPRIWPVLFAHYLQAVELQFSYNHDFSCSAAGLLADALYYRVPYQITSSVTYLLYAAADGAVLWALAGRYRAGQLRLVQWAPVTLIGVVLLNPRIMEYDVAPLTVPMALVLWRLCRQGRSERQALGWAGTLFVALNLLSRWEWRPTECFVLFGLFGFGSAQLLYPDKLSQWKLWAPSSLQPEA